MRSDRQARLQLGLPDWVGNRAQSGNPADSRRRSSLLRHCESGRYAHEELGAVGVLAPVGHGQQEGLVVFEKEVLV